MKEYNVAMFEGEVGSLPRKVTLLCCLSSETILAPLLRPCYQRARSKVATGNHNYFFDCLGTQFRRFCLIANAENVCF